MSRCSTCGRTLLAGHLRSHQGSNGNICPGSYGLPESPRDALLGTIAQALYDGATHRSHAAQSALRQVGCDTTTTKPDVVTALRKALS